jgi:hypothetical protein
LAAGSGKQVERGTWADLVPTRLALRPLKHGKHTVVFTKNPANRSGYENLDGLQFAQQQEAEALVKVGTGENNRRDWGVSISSPWM